MACIGDDRYGYVRVKLPLDQATVDWLNRLSECTGDRPEAIIASMLRDIRVDDEAANSTFH